MPFLDGKVSDAVTVRYTFCPLTFHYGAWEVTKLIPYMEDLCYEQKQCDKFIEYVTLAFDEMGWWSTSTDISQNELIQKWTQTVADKMKLDLDDLRSVYNYGTDTHNSERRTRYMWKYTSARTVSGTPSAFVNGVKLQNIPKTADQWLQLVTDVYNSQTKLKMSMEEQQEMLREWVFLK